MGECVAKESRNEPFANKGEVPSCVGPLSAPGEKPLNASRDDRPRVLIRSRLPTWMPESA